MSPKRLVKVVLVVVGSGQNKILIWDFDHWTKVRIRRDNEYNNDINKFIGNTQKRLGIAMETVSLLHDWILVNLVVRAVLSSADTEGLMNCQYLQGLASNAQ